MAFIGRHSGSQAQRGLPGALAARRLGLPAQRRAPRGTDFIGFFISKSERIFLVLQREQTDLVELCFKHL